MGRILSAAGLAALLFVIAFRSADAAVIEIKMEQIAHAPARVSARVGDAVEWVNGDIVAHTATARNGAWDVMVGPNSKGSVVLKSPGTIEYYCRFHPNMVGSIGVSE
jgi:plastocyanin